MIKNLIFFVQIFNYFRKKSPLKDGDYILAKNFKNSLMVKNVVLTGDGLFSYSDFSSYFALVYNQEKKFWHWVNSPCRACKRKRSYYDILNLFY